MDDYSYSPYYDVHVPSTTVKIIHFEDLFDPFDYTTFQTIYLSCCLVTLFIISFTTLVWTYLQLFPDN